MHTPFSRETSQWSRRKILRALARFGCRAMESARVQDVEAFAALTLRLAKAHGAQSSTLGEYVLDAAWFTASPWDA